MTLKQYITCMYNDNMALLHSTWNNTKKTLLNYCTIFKHVKSYLLHNLWMFLLVQVLYIDYVISKWTEHFFLYPGHNVCTDYAWQPWSQSVLRNQSTVTANKWAMIFPCFRQHSDWKFLRLNEARRTYQYFPDLELIKR